MPGRHTDVTAPSENWDEYFEFQHPAQGLRLAKVPVEMKRVHQHSRAPYSFDRANSPKQAENWDEDADASPSRKFNHMRPSIPRQLMKEKQVDVENWDEDFPIRTRSTQGSPTKRCTSSPCSSFDDEVDCLNDDEELTLTSRDRPRVDRITTVPVLPSGLETDPMPFPRSPTISIFSNTHSSTTGRESAAHFYSSTTHLGSPSGHSNAFWPSDTPAHRERRRLRKKSRPPHLDDSLFELEDRPSSPPPPLPLPNGTSTPPRPSSPIALTTEVVPMSPSKSPLLSRIGSVKNWATRRRRSNTNPGEGVISETNVSIPQTSGSSPITQTHPRMSWFSRNGSASASSPVREAPAPYSLAAEGDQVLPATTSPVRRKGSGVFRAKRTQDDLGGLNRPTSIHSPPLLVQNVSASFPTNGAMQALQESNAPQTLSAGNRRFLGGARRISFGAGKKHRRAKGSTDSSLVKEVPDEDMLAHFELSPCMTDFSTPQSLPANLSAGSDCNLPFSPDGHAPLSRIPSIVDRPIPSPQSASLGRGTQPPPLGTPGAVMRRNSLGDLKIPTRISQAQTGLKRDLGLIKEFAVCVAQLRDLHAVYRSLVQNIEAVLDAPQPQSRSSSPLFFNIHFPGSRSRSNTNPLTIPNKSNKQIAAAFLAIDSNYKLCWECAELLIELGGSSIPTSVSAPLGTNDHEWATTLPRNEERALAQLRSADLSNESENVPIGGNDLSGRQLGLLREMLESSIVDAEVNDSEVNGIGPIDREWRWGDATNSTLTFPSDSSQAELPAVERRGRRLGMKALRDALRVLTRNFRASNTNGVQTDVNDTERSHQYTHPRIPPEQQVVLDAEPGELSRSEGSPKPQYHTPSIGPLPKASPRRPSIASIFRLGHRNRSAASADGTTDSSSNIASLGTSANGSSGVFEEEEGWDRMDNANGPDAATWNGIDPSAMLTVRGRSPGPSYLRRPSDQATTPRRTHSVSGASHLQPSSFPDAHHLLKTWKQPSTLSGGKPGFSAPGRKPSIRTNEKASSVRSAPPTIDQSAVAMTPENIGPLLANAKEVHSRCVECVAEVRELLGRRSSTEDEKNEVAAIHCA